MDKNELILEIERRIAYEQSQVKAKGDYCDGQAFAYLMALSYIKTLDEPKFCEIKEFNKPRFPNDKKHIKYYGCSVCEYDLGRLEHDTKFCPDCGRRIKSE